MVSEQTKNTARKKAGLYTIFGGIGVLTLGYLLLAQNSITLAPILIIGAFIIMAVGILVGWD